MLLAIHLIYVPEHAMILPAAAGIIVLVEQLISFSCDGQSVQMRPNARRALLNHSYHIRCLVQENYGLRNLCRRCRG